MRFPPTILVLALEQPRDNLVALHHVRRVHEVHGHDAPVGAADANVLGGAVLERVFLLISKESAEAATTAEMRTSQRHGSRRMQKTTKRAQIQQLARWGTLTHAETATHIIEAEDESLVRLLAECQVGGRGRVRGSAGRCDCQKKTEFM